MCRRPEAPQTPAETGNYEQRVLDHIVQNAIKCADAIVAVNRFAHGSAETLSISHRRRSPKREMNQIFWRRQSYTGTRRVHRVGKALVDARVQQRAIEIGVDVATAARDA